MKTIKNMAIIGAGVAGLALAIFARKQGIHVTLFERSKCLSSIGAGVTLWPNATFVMKQLGLIDEVIHSGGQPCFMHQFNRQGRQTNTFDIGALNAMCEHPTVNILRRDLIKILGDALEMMGATILFNHTIKAEDITQLKQQFDLVVGSDGRMHSAARASLYKDTMQPQYQGFINIIGLYQMNQSLCDHTIHEYRENGERFGIVPVTKQHGYWAAAWHCEMDDSRTLTSWFDEMHQRFRHWPSKIQKVLNNYDPNSLKRLFVHDLEPLPYWHNGNLIIIGDAAHAPLPTSGQGASQALEDAWHLSQLLNHNQSLDAVLKKFYSTRIDKTTQAQLIGRQVAQQIFHSTSSAPPTLPSLSTDQIRKLYMQGLSERATS
ncbi:FAD-dependent monooxygenase [Marinomonas ostreistagni]|uniref:FAD-dependent monooxygenase n=1 Tax=Marinomonas ostreistagni TaxID=359209 RepID=A0ABS0ZFT6_9GAMM|nr:FAD-dependent monooxygenase [Marinomonas ostreistagni]MBJ7552542.1 FAD-dependent monooxygenase [Marinomonas ostreistagni]